MELTHSPLKNWIPYKLINHDGQLLCKWINTFNTPFTGPFFDDTILGLKNINRKHSKVSSVSSLAMLESWASDTETVTPAAIIFHISRCGSTLISQLLCLSDRHIVLPEVPFFDDLLRLPYQQDSFTSDTASALLTAALKYYGQQRTGHEQHLYIKADSWHIFFYQQLRQLYPAVPFVLMYRNPAEVFHSHKKQPGMHAVPGLIEPAIFGFKPDEEMTLNLDAYLASILEKYLSQYHEIIQTDKNCLLMNYNEGAITMMQKLADFTNMKINDEYLLSIKERSTFHSKKPDSVFSESLPITIPHYLDSAVALYHQLEEYKNLQQAV